MKKLALLVFALAALAETASAQTATGTVAGSVTRNDGPRRRAMSGATVRLVSGSDTTYTTTVNGTYTFRKVPAGKARLEVRYVGYRTENVEISVTANRTTYSNIQIEEAPTDIEAIAVTAQIPVMSKSGDTLVYHAGAVRTLEGDYAEEIFKQLPGIEMEDGKIKAQGKDVSRIYVDGRELFGRNVMTALQNLMANDVRKLKVYDEYSEEALRTGRLQEDQKRRVIDIETKSKLLALTSGFTLGSLGTDMAKSENGHYQERYAAGLTLNYFADNLRVGLDANTGNIGRSSNRMSELLSSRGGGGGYNRNNSVKADVGFMRPVKFKEADSLFAKYARRINKGVDVSYSYKDSYSRSASAGEDVYFTDKYDTDTSSTISRSGTHNIELGYSNEYKGFSVGSNNTIYDRSGSGYNAKLQTADGQVVNHSSNRRRNSSNGYDLNESIRFRLDKIKLNFNAGFSYSEKGENTWSADTLPYVDNKKWIVSDADGYDRSFNANVNKMFLMIRKENGGLFGSLGYSYNYNNSLSRKMAVDQYTNQVDPHDTYDYRVNNNSHNLSAGLMFNYGKTFFNGTVAMRSIGMNRDENLPEDYRYDKRFTAIDPSVGIHIGDYSSKVMSLNYSTSTNTPSVDQLRNQLQEDQSQSTILTTGNPALKQSQTHSVSLSFNSTDTEKSRETRFGLGYSTTHNAIVSAKTYYGTDTTLPEYDNYQVEAGTTLYSYKNVNGNMSLNGSLDHNRYVPSVKSNARIGLRLSYSKSPLYIDDKLDFTETVSPSLTLALNSNFSRRISFRVNSGTTYRYSENADKKADASINQSVGASMRWDITNWMFANANYDYSKYFSLKGASKDNENQTLNVVAGFKAFKRMCDISVAAYDVLGRETNYNSTVTADHVSNRWSQTFGRYWIVSLSYRINASRSQGRGFGFSRFGREDHDGPDQYRMGAPAGGAVIMRGGFSGGGMGMPGGGGGRRR